MSDEGNTTPAKVASLKDDLMNGKGTKLLLLMASALFAAALAGSYNMAGRLASMESSVNAMVDNQTEIKARLLYLERENIRRDRRENN